MAIQNQDEILKKQKPTYSQPSRTPDAFFDNLKAVAKQEIKAVEQTASRASSTTQADAYRAAGNNSYFQQAMERGYGASGGGGDSFGSDSRSAMQTQDALGVVRQSTSDAKALVEGASKSAQATVEVGVEQFRDKTRIEEAKQTLDERGRSEQFALQQTEKLIQNRGQNIQLETLKKQADIQARKLAQQQNQFNATSQFKYRQLSQEKAIRLATLKESGRQFDKTLSQKNSQFKSSLKQDKTLTMNKLKESGRQFDKTLSQKNSQFKSSLKQTREIFDMKAKEDQRQFDLKLAEEKRQFKINLANQRAAAARERRARARAYRSGYGRGYGKGYSSGKGASYTQGAARTYRVSSPPPQYAPSDKLKLGQGPISDKYLSRTQPGRSLMFKRVYEADRRQQTQQSARNRLGIGEITPLKIF